MTSFRKEETIKWFLSDKTGNENDIYKDLIGKIERYHDKYFRDLQNEHEDTERNREFRQLMYPLRCFGHQMLWYGWTCNEIRKLGIDLNDAEDEEEMKRRRKEIMKIMLEKIYDGEVTHKVTIYNENFQNN